MWLKLTRPSGEPVVVDFGKVLMIDKVKDGSKLSYPFITKDSKAAETFKGTIVKEDVETIGKMLRAKA
jgi:hypothetical protein